MGVIRWPPLCFRACYTLLKIELLTVLVLAEFASRRCACSRRCFISVLNVNALTQAIDGDAAIVDDQQYVLQVA